MGWLNYAYMLSAPKPALPSLNALKHFEAAARHESFLRAAHELGVTPGAVAQQIKYLEDWVGQPLFVRHSQGVSLRREAASLLQGFSEAFASLTAAVQSLRSTMTPHQVRIAALPCVAQLWLPQRLQTLQSAFPDVEISITAMEEPPQFGRELFDFGLFYLKAAPKGTSVIWLKRDTLFPVCSSALASTSAGDLPQQTLIHDSTWKSFWRMWLAQAGLENVLHNRGPTYSLYSVALQAAIGGGGILIGRGSLVGPALRTGQLVRPFPEEVEAPDTLAIIFPSDRVLPASQVQMIKALTSLDDPESSPAPLRQTEAGEG